MNNWFNLQPTGQPARQPTALPPLTYESAKALLGGNAGEGLPPAMDFRSLMQVYNSGAALPSDRPVFSDDASAMASSVTPQRYKDAAELLIQNMAGMPVPHAPVTPGVRRGPFGGFGGGKPAAPAAVPSYLSRYLSPDLAQVTANLGLSNPYAPGFEHPLGVLDVPSFALTPQEQAEQAGIRQAVTQSGIDLSRRGGAAGAFMNRGRGAESYTFAQPFQSVVDPSAIHNIPGIGSVVSMQDVPEKYRPGYEPDTGLGTLLSIAAPFVLGPLGFGLSNIMAGAIGGGLGSLASGGNPLIGAVGGALGPAIGGFAPSIPGFSSLPGPLQTAATGALTGGTLSALRGGDFSTGALSGAVGGGFGSYLGSQGIPSYISSPLAQVAANMATGRPVNPQQVAMSAVSKAIPQFLGARQ